MVQVFFIRSGKLIGRDHFYLRIADGEEEQGILTSFVKQFYAGTPYIPREIVLQSEIEEEEVISEWLAKRKGQKVYLRVPKKGTKERLVELAKKNARMVLSQEQRAYQERRRKNDRCLKRNRRTLRTGWNPSGRGL